MWTDSPSSIANSSLLTDHVQSPLPSPRIASLERSAAATEASPPGSRHASPSRYSRPRSPRNTPEKDAGRPAGAREVKQDARTSAWARLREDHQDKVAKKKAAKGDDFRRWMAVLEDPNMKAPKSWNERLNVLAAYKERHGDCNVPRDYAVVWLATWVRQQRAEYLRFQVSDCRTPLTQERVDALDALGFDWDEFAPLEMKLGEIGVAFSAQGWVATDGAASRALAAEKKAQKSHEHNQKLVAQLKEARRAARSARSDAVGLERQLDASLVDAELESTKLRDANGRLVDGLALARVEEKKAHEAYLRQRLEIRELKKELLRCYSLLRSHGIDPTSAPTHGA